MPYRSRPVNRGHLQRMEGQMDAVGDVFKMKDLYWHRWRAANTIQFAFFRYRQRKLKKELRWDAQDHLATL